MPPPKLLALFAPYCTVQSKSLRAEALPAIRTLSHSFHEIHSKLGTTNTNRFSWSRLETDFRLRNRCYYQFMWLAIQIVGRANFRYVLRDSRHEGLYHTVSTYYRQCISIVNEYSSSLYNEPSWEYKFLPKSDTSGFKNIGELLLPCGRISDLRTLARFRSRCYYYFCSILYVTGQPYSG